MKILVATGFTQGAEANDFHYCIEGELVWVQEPCDRGADDPDNACGCGRGFAGAASHRATTTATVVESTISRTELVLAFGTSLADGGWPTNWADTVAGENLAIAGDLPVGAVIGRRLDEFVVRAIRLK